MRMGFPAEAITAILGNAVALGSLITAIAAWRGSRAEKPVIRVKRGDESVLIDLDNPDEAEKFIQELLDRKSSGKREGQ